MKLYYQITGINTYLALRIQQLEIWYKIDIF